MIEFFKDMYDPIRTGDFDDGYIMAATVVGAILDITILIFCIIVLGADPNDLRGHLHDWAVSEYKYVAWIIMGVMALSWILLISYNEIVSEHGRYNQPKSYAIAAHVVYYTHHILNGSALIMLPIVFIGTSVMKFGRFIAGITEFVLHISEYIADFNNRANTKNTAVKTKVNSAYKEYDTFLNPPKQSTTNTRWW